MAVDCRPGTPDDVMERVLRRAEVAKMTRKLQDRLALANYKTKHGLDNLSFSLVEAHFDSDLSRRRAASSVVSSESSSSGSDDMIPYTQAYLSSPVEAPMFSDNTFHNDGGIGSRKRAKFQAHYAGPTPTSSARKFRKNRAATRSSPIRRSKTEQNLTASSPLEARFQSGFRTAQGPNFSFVSNASTIPDSPPFASSDNEASCNPAVFHGSLPRTPPPTRTRGLRSRKGGASNGEEGADLLLYLATSPSPAQVQKSAPRTFPPSTPPSNPVALPSSMIHTPGGGNNLFPGFSTPGQQFNFADFVNVTPSPAQGAFNRTPGPAKTPLAAREARRRLNFDSLLPPSSSPSMTTRNGGVNAGLGMELGGELGS